MISQKMKKLVAGSSAIRAMFEEGKRMIAQRGEENVFDFSLGNPSILPPEDVKEAMKEVIETEDPMLIHSYMNNAGYEDVRKTIADTINQKNSSSFTEKNIIMTVGAAGGLNVALKAITDPGDEIVVIAPYFGEYKNYISNVDGVQVTVSPDTENFSVNFEELREKISPKTKALILNSPNNPTGALYSEEDIKKTADILLEKEKEYGISIYLITDEPYREIVFNGNKAVFVPKFYHNTIIGYSYAKSLSLPGERIGYLVIPSEIDDFEEVLGAMTVANRILGFVNAPSFMQRVIMRVADKTADLSVYERNEAKLYKALTEYGYEIVEPKGTFYMFPKCPIEDDKKFCEDAKEFGLVVVPGSTFGCPGYFRIAFCVSEEKVERSLPAFKKAIEKYR
ncbi:MAG: pyridoxal phosphate-dependent aminotransferase [Firmicutes bacterium]|nr:pyridoxal phosphate-dependent aminotransferase [Bacillota bacterium]